MSRLVTYFLQGLIKIYQYGISPYLPANCRYYPTCSAYANEALKVHGPFFGAWLTLRRLLRCHPFGGHGYDPVPPGKQNCHRCRTQSSDDASVE
ncbi:membrane protein insertion efficiency factor YidD [Sneathiella chinensis]|uniref:membrane protein insertion efficiency factor YidD n=1 Tax=Sneathiella chinensis TaxID=349750 RepID=UPI00146F58A3|nr:membrane protein insertion efficiency factor YidD [Sneathiella chinensis]